MVAGSGRLIYEPSFVFAVHTDAADVGFGGTTGRNLQAGSEGELEVQNIWPPFSRPGRINLRELKAVRLTLESEPVQPILKAPGEKKIETLLLHVENLPIVHMLNNMVSASPALWKNFAPSTCYSSA